MKIAVCLSGQLRTAPMCGRRIVDFFENYDVDYFIHTWKQEFEFTRNSDRLNVKNFLKDVDESKFEAVKSIFNPKKSKWEDSITFVLPSAQPQQYSFYQANELRKQYEKESGIKYDLVVKLRFDIIWEPKKSFSVPENFDDSSLYVSMIDTSQVHPRLLDRFFFCGPSTMDELAKITHFTNKNVSDIFSGQMKVKNYKEFLCPEEQLFYFARQQNIGVKCHGMMECIVRSNASHLNVYDDFSEIDKLSYQFYKS